MKLRLIHRLGRRVSWAGLGLLVLIGAVPLASPASHPTRTVGCGALALATLMNLEGREITADRVAASLPDLPDHSMADLLAVARTLGCPLSGVHLDRQNWPLDRPALVHLDRQGVGHFIVIRPVGTTGRLVQLIDPMRDPAVKEADSFFGSRQWTGFALIPSRWSDHLNVRTGMLSIGIAVVLYGFRLIRGRSS